MPWSSRTPSPIPWFSMLSMWSVRGRGDAGCPYAGALPTLPLGARGSGGTEVLARVCGPAGTGVLARVCGCGGLGARGSWHVSAALRAGGSWHVSAAVQPGPWGHGGPGTCVRLWRHAPGNTGRLLSRTVRHGCPGSCLWLCSQATGKQSANFFSRTVLRSTRKKVWTVFRCVTSQCLQSSGAAAKTAVPFCPQRLVSLPRPPSSSSSSSPPLLRSTRPGVPGPSLVTPGP